MEQASNHKILAHTAKRMGDMFSPNQVLGRLQTIGCVAVEITQKCNLDCTLCYLSEHSQQVSDIPIEEVFRRLDDVLINYGKGTHVQITGGDPTLRKHSELVQIVKYANDIGLYTALFTNGISATRKLLTQLAEVGLRDVAFHVDTTQRRTEGETEEELNQIRLEYLERVKGLDLMVIFNTTIHTDNFDQLPDLIDFFRAHADQIGLVSFQLQADTGRGELGKRGAIINKATVQSQIERATGGEYAWDAVQVGHLECHSYLPTLVINSNIHPLVPDAKFFADFLEDFQQISWDRQASKINLLTGFFKALILRPKWWPRLVMYSIGFCRRSWHDLFKSGFKVNKLTFFVQNFMDANELNHKRVEACSFMVMTHQGPVSMCQHNASRDDYILSPLSIRRKDGTTLGYKPLEKVGVINS